MDTKNVILELRTKMGLSQDELAEKVFVISFNTVIQQEDDQKKHIHHNSSNN